MSVTALCQICEQAAAIATCDRCGGSVCERHYVRRAGLCTTCAAGTTMG